MKNKHTWAFEKNIEVSKEQDKLGIPTIQRVPHSFKNYDAKQTHVLKPFGPTIVYKKMPKNIIKIFNDFTDKEIKKKSKVDWSDQLVGKTSEEISFTPKLMNQVADFFLPIFQAYEEAKNFRNPHPDQTQVKVDVTSAWIVRSFSGDFNPLHVHSHCNISCIGYLKLPEDMEKEWEEDYKDHYPCKAMTEFFHEKSTSEYSGGLVLHPEIGDFILFPNDLHHTAYPFNSKGERRTFSMNIHTQVVQPEDNA